MWIWREDINIQSIVTGVGAGVWAGSRVRGRTGLHGEQRKQHPPRPRREKDDGLSSARGSTRCLGGTHGGIWKMIHEELAPPPQTFPELLKGPQASVLRTSLKTYLFSLSHLTQKPLKPSLYLSNEGRLKIPHNVTQNYFSTLIFFPLFYTLFILIPFVCFFYFILLLPFISFSPPKSSQ